MYYVYVTPRPSLRIESTDSMIIISFVETSNPAQSDMVTI